MPALTRRDDLSFTFDSSLKGAIAGAVVSIVLFIIGCIVFIYFYNRASRKPQTAHVGPDALYTSSSASSNGDLEKATPDSTPPTTPTMCVTPPEPVRQKPAGRISRLVPARLMVLSRGEDAGKRLSGASVDVPETPRKEFV